MLERVVAVLVGAPFAIGMSAGSGPEGERVAFRFADPAIVESSGLVARGGLVVTTNDSGDSGRVFVVDPADGRTVGRTSWAGEPRDIEALSPAGPGEVWVGDIGDNAGGRDSVEVLRVPVGRGDRRVEPDTFELTYPGGARDAETLLAHPGDGRLVVVSKEIFGSTVYQAPATLDADRPNRLEPVGDGISVATDGAFFPDGRHLVLRSYRDATVFTWPDLEEVGSLDLPRQKQGEGIAVDEAGRVYVSTEGARSKVHVVDLPRDVRRAVGGPTDASAGAGTAGDAETRTTGLRGLRENWPWSLAAGLVLAAVVVLHRRFIR